MSCGCGKERTRNVEVLWGQIGHLESYKDDLQAQVERLTQERDGVQGWFWAMYSTMGKKLRVIEDERDRLEGLQQQAQELILMAEDYRDGRDEANRQLAAVAEALGKFRHTESPTYAGDFEKLCHLTNTLLSDIPAAAQEIGAKLERAEKLERLARAYARLLDAYKWMNRRDKEEIVHEAELLLTDLKWGTLPITRAALREEGK